MAEGNINLQRRPRTQQSPTSSMIFFNGGAGRASTS
jgi:hypothetical protein